MEISERATMTAMSFKPFINPKCTEHEDIVKDMAKAIQSAMNSVATSENSETLKT